MAVRNKSHSGAKKRFKRTANGVKRKQANHRHNLDNGRSTKGKRKLRTTTMVDKADLPAIERMLDGQ